VIARRVFHLVALTASLLIAMLVAPRTERAISVHPLAVEAACETDGVEVRWQAAYTAVGPAGYRVTAVEVRDISANCAGHVLGVTLRDGTTDLGTGTATIDSSVETVEIASQPPARYVDGVTVQIAPSGGEPPPPPSPTEPPVPVPKACVAMAFGEQMLGTASGEELTGTAGNDLIVALEGADLLVGLAGDDCLDADDGDDMLEGGAGSDVLLGGNGVDSGSGGSGVDRVYGGAGDDALGGGGQADRLRGGTGNDSLRGGEGSDVLRGGDGFDVCYGGAGRDRFAGCEVIKRR
jgi:Ca2+-binding RTX toxin-like protein